MTPEESESGVFVTPRIWNRLKFLQDENDKLRAVNERLRLVVATINEIRKGIRSQYLDLALWGSLCRQVDALEKP